MCIFVRIFKLSNKCFFICFFNFLDGSECDLLNEEQRRIAELGKPRLGEFPKLEVIIEESYEFKVGFITTFYLIFICIEFNIVIFLNI